MIRKWPPFYEIIDFYLLYYDNSYNFFGFPNQGFCKQGMQWNTYYTKFVIGKQDGSKVEGKNLGKKRNFYQYKSV